MLVYVTLVDNL